MRAREARGTSDKPFILDILVGGRETQKPIRFVPQKHRPGSSSSRRSVGFKNYFLRSNWVRWSVSKISKRSSLDSSVRLKIRVSREKHVHAAKPHEGPGLENINSASHHDEDAGISEELSQFASSLVSV